MSHVYHGPERRNFKRVKVNLIVVYREDAPLDVHIRASGVDYQASMVDISEGGMSILTEANIAVSTTLWIKFSLLDRKDKGVDFYGTMELKGKVLSNILLEGDTHRLGIQFFSVEEKDKSDIAHFVEIIDQRFNPGS